MKPKSRTRLVILVVCSVALCVAVLLPFGLLTRIRNGLSVVVAKFSPVVPLKVSSSAMAPTLTKGDVVWADKTAYDHADPKDGDIVAFYPPKWACTPDQMDSDGQVVVHFLKRCVGVPGDVVEVRHGVLYRNGKAVPEPYVKSPMTSDFKLVHHPKNPMVKGTQGEYWPVVFSGEQVNDDPGFTAVPFLTEDDMEGQTLKKLPPASIPAGYYLVMGDNRNDSFDSRAWGLMPRASIVGKITLH